MTEMESLARYCEEKADAIIQEIDGGPDGGYGPRLWLRYGRKKRALAAARDIQSEASLIRRTATERKGPA